MNAIDQIQHDRFYFEARVYADEYNLPVEDVERIAASLRHRAYLEEIKPITDQMAAIHSNAKGVTFMYREDAPTHTEWRLIPEQQKSMDLLLDLMASIRRSYFPEPSNADSASQ